MSERMVESGYFHLAVLNGGVDVLKTQNHSGSMSLCQCAGKRERAADGPKSSAATWLRCMASLL